MKMFWLPMQVTGSRLSESVGRPRTMRLAASVEPESSVPSSSVEAASSAGSSVSPLLLQPASDAMAASAPMAAAPLTNVRLLSLVCSMSVSSGYGCALRIVGVCGAKRISAASRSGHVAERLKCTFSHYSSGLGSAVPRSEGGLLFNW